MISLELGILFALLFILSAVFFMSFRKMSNKHDDYLNQIIHLEKDNVLLKSKNEYLLEQNRVIKSSIDKSESNLKTQFENYTNQILKNKSEILQKQTNDNISSLLNPLKEKITEFQLKVEQTYQDESREIFSLKNEVHKLLSNNANMVKETENLTNALKGNVKAQGIWGEIILEKILESSGLREGEEYVTQGRDLDLKNENNQSLRPDVIINLPDNKHIIVDAKVSLKHYEQYIEALGSSNKSAEQENLALFIKSIQNHVANLSSKSYQYNDKLLSPDFVILFFPIEGAFSIALQQMPDLLMQAWNKKIIIVSPTTLFATLKTIASIWLFEKQNKNALKIANESGLLYDKFVSFTEDLYKIGSAIEKVDESYNNALNKLSQGRGNIISKTEKIRLLGAKAKKQLSKELTNNIIESDDAEDSNDNIISSDSMVDSERELASD